MLDEPAVLIAKEMNVTTERWLISTDSIDILPYCINPVEVLFLPFKAVLRVLRGPIVTYTLYKNRRRTPQSV